jgi:autotransporter adhesin
MKKSFLAVAVMSVMSVQAYATIIPASAVSLKNGGNVQLAVDQFAGQIGGLSSDIVGLNKTTADIQARNVQQDKDIHDTYVLANSKYTESAGKALEATVASNKADQAKRDAGQDAVINTKVSQADFAVDQARQDKALADTKKAQSGTDYNQDLAIDKNRQDIKRVDSDIATKVDQTAYDADKKAQGGTDGNQDRLIDKNANDIKRVDSDIASNVATQAKTDAGQDRRIDNNDAKIGVVQGEVQQNRADIKTKADQTYVDGGFKSLHTEVSKKVDSQVFEQRAQDLDTRIINNKAEQQKVNKVMSERLDNHEGRITDLESRTNGKFADIDKRLDDNRKKANAGTSTALAAAGIPQVLESQSFALGAAVGGYESEQAVAVGFSARVSSAVVVKAAVGTDTQHGIGYNAGVSIGW